MIRYQHLVGRPFLYGVRDCYSMVRDIYRDNFGLELTDFARPSDWKSDTRELIRNLHEVDGFMMITDWKASDLRPADILVMSIGESNPNHLAVFVGDNKVVHHLWGRLSADETYRDFFRHSTSFLLRHPVVPDLRPELPSTDIRSLLRGRYNLPTSE